MDATMAPPGYITNQQPQQGVQGPPVMVISQQAAGSGNHYRPPSGHVGPVIGVLAVIAVLGILAGLVGRLCSGRTVMGYGPRFDVEAWLESKCASCLDGHVAPPRAPHHPHMHMNTHIVMDSLPAAVPGGGGGGGGGGRSAERPHPHQHLHPQPRPQQHLHPEVLLRPLPTHHQGPGANRSANSPAAGRPEPEIRTMREQQEDQRQRPRDDVVHEDEDDDEDDVSDFSDHDEEELHHNQHYQEQIQQQQQPHHQPH